MDEENLSEKVSVHTLLMTFITTALLTFVFNVFIYFLPSKAYCTQSVSVLAFDLMGWPFFTILILGLLKLISPSLQRYMNITKLTYIYIITYAAATFSNFGNPWWWDIGLLLARTVTSETVLMYVPEFVAVPKDAATLLINGCGSIFNIPWDVLLPAMIWHTLISALFIGICIGFASIIRREWVDIERLPFPQVTLAYTSILGLDNVKNRQWTGRTAFILGFIAGFLLEIPISGVNLFPWFPDLYSWRTNTCGPGLHQITIYGQPWNLGFDKDPLTYAIFMLVPLNSLIAMVFYVLVLELALYIAWYTGYYTGIENIGFCGRYWCSPTPYGDPPYYFSAIITGAGLGLFVITILLERHYIVNTLKVAFRKSSAKEEEEPMSYKTAWVIFIIFFIMMVIFLMYTGMSPWVSFVATLTGLITWIVATIIWARLATISTPCFWITPGLIKMLTWPTDIYLPITSTDLALIGPLSRHWIGHRNLAGWGNSFYISIGSYHIGRLTGVHPRNIVKVLTVALFTAVFMGHIMQIVLPGVYGGKIAMTGSPSLVLIMEIESFTSGGFWNVPTRTPISEVAPHLAIGFIFMIVMRYLSTKILWLPDPIAALVAWWWLPPWSAALISGIIKYLVLKIGGSKLYEEQVMPFVGGFVLGVTLEIFMAAMGFYALYSRI
ncbi:MAG: DUF6785 family protein [Candidatus Bathyarchaeia archaeon]